MSRVKQLRFDTATISIALITAAVSCALLPRVGVQVSQASLVRGAATLAVLFVLGIVYERRDHRLSDTIRMTALGITLSYVYPLPMYLVGATGSSFVDGALLAADRTIGVEVGALVRLVRRSDALNWISQKTYNSLLYFAVGALIAPPLAGRTARTRVMIVAIMVAGIISLVVFAHAQAFGPWASGSFVPTQIQADTEAELRTLHAGSRLVLDLNSAGGIMAIPSWHVILALVSAHALAMNRPLAIAAWACAGLIVLSTLTTGWHYFVDALCGVFVAALSLAAAERVCNTLLGRTTGQ